MNKCFLDNVTSRMIIIQKIEYCPDENMELTNWTNVYSNFYE